MAIFEGSRLFGAQYGLLECLRGQFPESQSNERSQQIVSAVFPSAVDPKEKITISFDLTTPCEHLLENDLLGDNAVTSRCIESFNRHLAGQPISKLHQLSIMSALWTVDAIRGTSYSKLRVVKLRIRCLFDLISSRRIETLLGYFHAESSLMQDIFSLSDISSQNLMDLMLEPQSQLVVASMALECCMCMVRCALRKRGSYLQLGVDRGIGLIRVNSSEVDPIGGTHDVLWISIVLAACSAANASCMVDASHQEQTAVLGSDEYQLYMDPIESDINRALYLRIALELFATALSASDLYPVRSDSTPLIGAMVYFLHGASHYLTQLFQSLDISSNIKTPATSNKSSITSSHVSLFSEQDKHIMWAMSKSLACLDLAFEEQEYQAVIRSSDVVGLVATILELFSSHEIITRADAGIAAKSVVENSLSVLTHSLNKSRRAMLNASDSGIQVLYRPFFPRLCMHVFQSYSVDNEYLWFHVLSIIRAGINLEPTFLSQFLRAPYSQALNNVLQTQQHQQQSGNKWNENDPFYISMASNADLILIPLAKLAQEMCITADGQAFVRNTDIVKFIIDSFASPLLVMPKSVGISPDTSSKCGRSLTQIMRDCPGFKDKMKRQFQTLIIDLCAEAKNCSAALTVNQSPAYDTNRMRILQQLTNLFGLVEHLGVDGRRQSTEAIRDILNKEIISGLVDAFDCTLPAGRKLFSQLSVRSTSAIAVVAGNFNAVKALNSMLRVVSHVAPMILLPILQRVFDDVLQEIGEIKAELTVYSSSSTQSDSDSSNVSEPSTPNIASSTSKKASLLASMSAQKRELRQLSDVLFKQKSTSGSPASSASSASSVHILGILDTIPHVCMFEKAFDDLSTPYNDAIWRLLQLIKKLEWVSELFVSSVRLISRMQGQGQFPVSISREFIRKIYAFNRSSLMEICRFSSTKLTSKV